MCIPEATGLALRRTHKKNTQTVSSTSHPFHSSKDVIRPYILTQNTSLIFASMIGIRVLTAKIENSLSVSLRHNTNSNRSVKEFPDLNKELFYCAE